MIFRTMFTFLLFSLVACSSEYFSLRNNGRIVFFGDSITLMGIKQNGYITIIKDSLSKKFPSLEIIGAGVSGNKVPDLLARVNRDVLANHPTVVVLYIGVNDVWHFMTPGQTGTPNDVYEAGLKKLVTQLQQNDIHVILCTPSVVGEKKDHANPLDAKLDEYSAISRRVAQQTNIALCDLRKAFVEYLQTHNPKNASEGILTVDSVHLNDEGNRLVAHELLKVLDR